MAIAFVILVESVILVSVVLVVECTGFEKNLRVYQYPIPVSLRVFFRPSTQFLKLIRVFYEFKFTIFL